MGKTARRLRRSVSLGAGAFMNEMTEMTEPVKVGVIGVGYLGRFHAEKYAALAETELVGVADLNRDQARKVAHALHTRDFVDYRELLPLVSAVSVAVPTSQHFAVVRDCLAAGCQVLVEKPITTTVAEADELVHLSRERGLILMVGHLERFNSAMEELKSRVTQPRFIESHRLSFFKERGTDVDVVLDLMIHDLDHVLNLVPSPVAEIRAAGISVLTDRVDLANVRLEFDRRLHRQPHRLPHVLQVHAQVPPLPARGLPGGGF